MDTLRTEVIIATHDNPVALDLCLGALVPQAGSDIALCVAEDGECAETGAVVERWVKALAPGRLRHVRQPHQGFRKNRILNQAIASSTADYLIFVDGDCLALPGFLGRHLEARRPGRFLSGGVIRLDREETRAVVEGSAGRSCTLRAPRPWSLERFLKSGVLPRWLAVALERVTPVPCTWNGGNSSGWREDLLAVNGFDESLGYGADDVDLGFRLELRGVRGFQVRYTARLLHLEHARSSSDLDASRRNAVEIRRTRLSRPAWAPEGIRRN